MQTEQLHQAIANYGKPEVINSDQGGSTLVLTWVDTLKELGIATFLEKYNRQIHQGINRRKPVELYGYAA